MPAASSAASFGRLRSKYPASIPLRDHGDAAAVGRDASRPGSASLKTRSASTSRPADLLEHLLLRVGLPQHLLVDVLDRDPPAMALGLDRVDAARPDDDVVPSLVPAQPASGAVRPDVAATEVDVVEDVPVGTEPVERRADLALARRPARPAFADGPVAAEPMTIARSATSSISISANPCPPSATKATPGAPPASRRPRRGAAASRSASACTCAPASCLPSIPHRSDHLHRSGAAKSSRADFSR